MKLKKKCKTLRFTTLREEMIHEPKKKNENSDHQGLLQSSPKVTSLSDLTSVLLCDKQQPPHDESEVEG